VPKVAAEPRIKPRRPKALNWDIFHPFLREPYSPKINDTAVPTSTAAMTRNASFR
jgi:hypothetical protein